MDDVARFAIIIFNEVQISVVTYGRTGSDAFLFHGNRLENGISLISNIQFTSPIPYL